MTGTTPEQPVVDAQDAPALTVAEAEKAVSELTGDAAKVARLLATCLNAEAALHMLGCKSPRRRRKGAFLPAGVQTLVEIEDLLATMPAETALVRASMAFACDFCGMPAESGTHDAWICDGCIRRGSEGDGASSRPPMNPNAVPGTNHSGGPS